MLRQLIDVLRGAGARDPATLAANQHEFRVALAQNLSAAGHADADLRAGAIITVCDGLIIDFLLYGEADQPKEIARQAAAALGELALPAEAT